MPPSPPFGRLVVIGLGLIGGSLASAARLRGLCTSVWGIARNEATCARAVELGVVDQAHTALSDIAAQLTSGDIIFIAVPTLSVRQIFQDIQNCVSPDVTVTDGASVKGSVLADVKYVFGEVPSQVVLGHPIAGSEKSGVEAADPTLYEQHRVILTPTSETGEAHLQRVAGLWQQVGAEVLQMAVAEHDEILAATSHLPHAIAYSLVDTLAHDSQNENIFRYAAGGFRDFTRIASSDATMWRDIMLANQQSVLKAMDLFVANLGRLRLAVEQGDGSELLGIFTRAKAARDHFTIMLEKRRYSSPRINSQRNMTLSTDRPLMGTLRLPGDQSISHCALIIGALSEGITEIGGFWESEDTLATLQALRDMNVVIAGPSTEVVQVHGVGLYGLKAPVGPLYLGSSASSMQLLAGLLAAQSFDSELIGDDSLNQCSMQPIVEVLRQMGAVMETGPETTAPLRITGGQVLHGIKYAEPMATGQVKSCLLLAGLYSHGRTAITASRGCRDSMERTLQGFGYPVQINSVQDNDRTIVIKSGGRLQAQTMVVPADLSMAMNFILAATLVPGSNILLTHIGTNPGCTGGIEILKKMGANIRLLNERQIGGDSVADIQVQSAALSGIDISDKMLNRAIDEFPILLVAASCADGETRIFGVDALNDKAATRLDGMRIGLQKLGIRLRTLSNGLIVSGGRLSDAEIDCSGDPQIALALAVAGLRASGPVMVRGCEGLDLAFPGFANFARQVGIGVDFC